ncbi:MAG TPA: SDR family oxidoreductase [Planctomicrobium sp.]|nr:SDR family oxidoreductase [Planctomicrobium sp.]
MNERPVAFITGASRGIGAETAREFARHGYDCVLVADESDRLDEVAFSLKALDAKTLICHGDLYDLDFARHSVERCQEQWGRIDVLVNNAAWREIVTMRRIELSSWEKTLRICLTVPAFLARWCAEVMEPTGRGVILNVSSIQSRFTSGISPAYIAAKGGLDSLTYELAALYGAAGIRVLSVNPGAIDTDLSKNHGSIKSDESLRNYVEGMIPLGRYGNPEEIAKTLIMLASDSASYLTGTCIEIDGGWSHQCTPYALKQMQMPEEFMKSRKPLTDV